MNQQAFHFDAAGIDCLKALLPLIPLSEKRENGIKPSELLAPDGLVYRLLVIQIYFQLSPQIVHLYFAGTQC